MYAVFRGGITTHVSEQHTVSIFSLEYQAKKKGFENCLAAPVFYLVLDPGDECGIVLRNVCEPTELYGVTFKR
jgi:hypothetical protein